MDGKSHSLSPCLFLLGLGSLFLVAGFLNAFIERDFEREMRGDFETKLNTMERNRSQKSGSILLVGGSNVIWGYRSRILEEQLGRPTTNLALPGEGISASALRRLVEGAAQKNDIVVYSSITFWNLGDVSDYSREIDHNGILKPLYHLFPSYPQGLSRYWLPAPRRVTLANGLAELLRRHVLGHSSYKFTYNDHGDITTCSCQECKFPPQEFSSPPDLVALRHTLGSFRDHLADRGAELVVEFPPINIKSSDRKHWILAYQPLLKSLQKDFTVATTDINSVLVSDGTEFCDGAVHLGDHGAVIRSQRMKAYLSSKGLAQKYLGKNEGNPTIPNSI